VSDIEGKTVFLGYPGTVTYGQIDKSLKALGIEFEVFVGSLADGIMAFKDGRIDVMGKATPLGPDIDAAYMEIISTVPITFLSYTQQDVDTIKLKYPWMMFAEIEAGNYAQLPDLGAIIINIYDNSIIAGKDFPEELAYKWVKSVVENWDECEFVFPANKYYDPVEAIQRIPEGIYLHAGAARYYQEVAYVPDCLIPPEMK
jgi:TRAP-type uncharacterized transport system substrate-binding protein